MIYTVAKMPREAIRRFCRLSFSNQILAMEIVLVLFFAWMITRFLPARYWLRWLQTEAVPEVSGIPNAVFGKANERNLSDNGQQPAVIHTGSSACNRKSKRSSLDLNISRKLGRAAGKVARYLPFEVRCLQQAMTMQWLLRHRRVDTILVFGVRRNMNVNHDLQYHAWLTVDGIPVIGGEEVDSYQVFPAFPPRDKL